MNLKSYLRGIGAGIIVAALVMGVSKERPKEEAIDKQRLIETVSVSKEEIDTDNINVIEETVSPVSTEQSLEEQGPEDKEAETEVKETEADEKNEAEVKEPETEVKEPEVKEEVKEPEAEEEPEEILPPQINPLPEDENGFEINGETVQIRVIKGDSSVSVSRRLYEAGLVESAVEFDKYLCENGFDKKICVGEFEIVSGSDFETIAKILSKRN